MKKAAIAAMVFATTAQAEIFQCAPGIFTDQPCTSGTTLTIRPGGQQTAPPAQIKFNLQQRTYPIHGKDYLSAFTNLRASGKFSAWAQWKLEYEYKHAQTGKQCTIDNLIITVSGDILMPEWVEQTRAPQQDQAAWNRGQRQLQIHEEGHIQHGKDAAVMLRTKLLPLSAENCESVDRWATTALSTTTLYLQQLDRDYDRVTQHGLRQFDHD
jgi:hypothetical protein